MLVYFWPGFFKGVELCGMESDKTKCIMTGTQNYCVYRRPVMSSLIATSSQLIAPLETTVLRPVCFQMEAWVTLTTNDSYSVGALALAASLRRVGTTR
jgi:hypothetical protein